jgi:hypothetical protein
MVSIVSKDKHRTIARQLLVLATPVVDNQNVFRASLTFVYMACFIPGCFDISSITCKLFR